MLLLGIDIGTSSVKVSAVDAASGISVASASFPETEAPVLSSRPGWAEQDPLSWWEQLQQAVRLLHAKGNYHPKDIAAIGIAYQMHGLVMLDKNNRVLRNSIIWCDSRAVQTGETAFQKIGEEKCLTRLLNSPGNFTAAKLAWVKQQEPDIYAKADKIMLPGDFIAGLLTGHYTTSISALSEGVFWDFRENKISEDVMESLDLNPALIPPVQDVFSTHGLLTKESAEQLGLSPGIPVSYKAGDQPNNAFSLGVLEPGEVAATAGTSGVMYGVTDQLAYDNQSRINSFAHVNHTSAHNRIGVLLCINGTGSLNRWIRQTAGAGLSYTEINAAASAIKPGSDGLRILPFGNGAERMLNNQLVHAHIYGIDLNQHQPAHLFRAAQEGVAFAFRYGFDIMRENGIVPQLIKAGQANMFRSAVFTRCLVNVLQVPVELYENDGSAGAAAGAGIGAGIYKNMNEAFAGLRRIALIEPEKNNPEQELYLSWLALLQKQISSLITI